MDNIDKNSKPTRPEKLEALEVNTLYALTVNPSDPYQGLEGKRWEDRRMNARKHIEKYFKDASLNSVYYWFVEEVSIPENNVLPRYHIHGFVYFTEASAFPYMLLELLTSISHKNVYSFKRVDDFEKWYTYCTKQEMFKEPITNIFYAHDIYRFLQEISAGGGPRSLAAPPVASEACNLVAVSRRRKRSKKL